MWVRNHWATLAGLFLTGLYIYLQLRQWQIHGDDLMLTAANIVVTCALWLTLVVAISKYWKDGRKSESLRSQIQTLKDEYTTQLEGMSKRHSKELEEKRLSLFEALQAQHGTGAQSGAATSKLKILSAVYGTDPSNDIDVTEVLKTRHRDALTFLVQNQLFGHDPAEGFLKRLKVEYSYGNPTVIQIERPEGSRVTIPGDSHLKGRIQKLEIAAKQHVESARTPRIEVQLLLVEYTSNGGNEHLIFVNDGHGTIQNIAIGPLLWSTAYRREINLHNVLGPLRAGQQVDCKFAVYEQIGNSQSMSPLTDVLREIARKGCEAEPEVTVSYQDTDGQAFSRRFVLAIDPFNRVVWNPDQVHRTDVVKAP